MTEFSTVFLVDEITVPVVGRSVGPAERGGGVTAEGAAAEVGAAVGVAPVPDLVEPGGYDRLRRLARAGSESEVLDADADAVLSKVVGSIVHSDSICCFIC